jgi:argininosuccinate synthase
MKRKIVLAYSGGLDTSIIIPWLKENYDCQVITYTADIGQGDELEKIQEKSLNSGADKAIVEDIQEEFVRDYLFPLLKSSAKYEGNYLLGTISRPLIAKKLVEVAKNNLCDAICHGATGKGNDQVRFELAIMQLASDIEIIAPWRIWDFKSREQCIDYAKNHNIPIDATKKSPYSTDKNIWYLSHEGGILEDCKNEAPDDIFTFTRHIKNAENLPEELEIEFLSGIPIAVNKNKTSGIEILNILNKIGARHAIGAVDIIENRVVGMKSRGVYEFPGAEILFQSHKMLESITIDKDTIHYKNKIALDYANLIYEGKFFCKLKNSLDAFINETQKNVSGIVKVKLYKGNIFPVSITSNYSLYNPNLAGFTMNSEYSQQDAKGFINIFGLPMKISGSVG